MGWSFAPQADRKSIELHASRFFPVGPDFIALVHIAHLDLLHTCPGPGDQQPDRLSICRGGHQAEDREQQESFHAVQAQWGRL